MGTPVPGTSLPIASSDTALATRLRDPAIFAVAGIAGVALLHFRDPHESTYIACPFLFLTGRPCPGCGGLRAINLLTNGELVAAMSSNLLAVALLLVVPVLWLRWVWRSARGAGEAQLFAMSNRTIGVATVLIAVFWVARLTPWGAWLAP